MFIIKTLSVDNTKLLRVGILLCGFWIFGCFSLFVSAQEIQKPKAVNRAFFPDLSLAPDTVLTKYPTTINAENVDEFDPFIDEDVTRLIREGKVSIKSVAPWVFPVNSAYIEATARYSEVVKLGDSPGVIKGYVAGRPFPDGLGIDDPNAGVKAAWNMRYSYMPDENEVKKFFWQYRNMRTAKVERQLKMYASMLRLKHRHDNGDKHDHKVHENQPDREDQVFNALYLRVDKPQDVRNTQLLIHRLEDDTSVERAWMYTATQRRVRRLATGQTTDAFLGSDIMIEDFLGYNGRIKDQQWTFQGSRWLLMPFYRHDDKAIAALSADDFASSFHGQGNCFPNVSWQMRWVHVLDAEPVNPDHPLSKRRYYLDAQTYTPALVKIYDRPGRLWKVGIMGAADSRYHHSANSAWESAIVDVVSMIDLQAEHCTTLQLLPRIPDKALRPNNFTMQYLRTRGR